MERITDEEHPVNTVSQPTITDVSLARTHVSASGSGCLRILHCCGQFAATQGGTERQARAVCGALAVRGHQVSVLARKSPGPEQVVPGVTVYVKIRAIDRGRLFGLTYVGSAMTGLLREAHRTDLLHAHHLYLDAIAALIAGRIRGRPVVAKMVGAGPGGDLDRLHRTAGGSLLLRLLHGLDAVIAPSATCQTELLEAGFPAERIHVVPNGVDISLFCPDPTPAPGKPPSVGEGRAVLFTGRLIEAKGLLELVDAWPLLLREVPDAHLVLVGSGPLEVELRQRAVLPPLAGRVHLTGEVPDVRPYLLAATAFVFPSWAEGLPNALLEAMAIGLPCVATDIGPIADAAINGEEALLVPVRSPQELAVALAKILTQPALAVRLGRAARKRVEAEFSLEHEVDALEALYRELTAGCGGRPAMRKPAVAMPDLPRPQAERVSTLRGNVEHPGVLMLISHFPPAVGGTERQAASLAEGLAASGHRVTILTLARMDAPPREERNGLLIERALIGSGRGPVFALTYGASLLYHMRRLQAGHAILHAHHLYLEAMAAVWAGRRAGLPAIAKVAGGGPDGDLARLRRAHLLWTLPLLRRLHRVVAISAEIEAELAAHGFGADRIVRIPNGVDVIRFAPPPDPEAAWRETGLGPETVLFLGRLEAEKGANVALHAWEKVVRSRPAAKLVLAGDGPTRAELEAEVRRLGLENRVRFLGARPDPETLLRASQVFVLPSRSEGMSNALLEAMATGLPCVATRVGGNRDLLEHEVTGLLVPPGDPEALADALAALLGCAELRARLGAAARAVAVEEYRMDRVLQRYAELYAVLAQEAV
jgi:glycosyltransferase involved in cell wall biosynthesis